jgi:3-oxoacyl-[acyl-carrier-protein] synthase-3
MGTSHETIDSGEHFFKMRGNEIFKVAVRNMSGISLEMLKKAGLTVDDVDLVIPHQATQRITDAVAKKLGVENDRVYSNIDRLGNTSSASIPIALDECMESGKLKEGDVLLLTAFGGGITWGGTVIRF